MNKIILILLLLGGLTFAQVSADLTIENQQVFGTDFLFDLYLTRTGTNDLYLGNADFVLTFDAVNFSSPSIIKEGVEYCTYIPTNNSAINNLFTQDLYYNNSAVDILNGNQIVINLNGPTPSDQNVFDTRVAKIDNTPSTHRLGRFKVSGITNPAGDMSLQWKVTGTGVTTQVFTLATVDPWLSSQVTINAINPSDHVLPVELASFTATAQSNAIILNWKTETETNNYGFEIERSINNDTQSTRVWQKIGFICGNGNSNSTNEYSFVDNNLYGGKNKFNYRLKQIDNEGAYKYSEIIEVKVVPDQFELSQNYPNPFNPSTNIRLSIPQTSEVKLAVYNLLGEEVETILQGIYEAGFYLINFNAQNLSNGIYFYRVESTNFVDTKKMILLK